MLSLEIKTQVTEELGKVADVNNPEGSWNQLSSEIKALAFQWAKEKPNTVTDEETQLAANLGDKLDYLAKEFVVAWLNGPNYRAEQHLNCVQAYLLSGEPHSAASLLLAGIQITDKFEEPRYQHLYKDYHSYITAILTELEEADSRDETPQFQDWIMLLKAMGRGIAQARLKANIQKQGHLSKRQP